MGLAAEGMKSPWRRWLVSELLSAAGLTASSRRRLDEAAQCMLRRAQGAVKDTEALLADQPGSMSWVDFAEGDLRAAREAKAELAKLLEQQKLLEFFLRKD